MKTKNIISVVCLILILATVGIGIATMYSIYFYRPLGDIDFFVVQSNNFGLYEEKDESEVLQAVDEWARENKATVIFREIISRNAGLGYCGYSSWIKDNLGIEDYSGEYGALILNDSDIIAAYVNDGIFLPGRLGVKVVGTYDSDKALRFITERKFLYPLTMSTSAQGAYFTDSDNMEEFIAVFEKYDYHVSGIQKKNNKTALERIREIMSESDSRNAVLFGIVGLSFCFVYLSLTVFADNYRRFRINHIFGLSVRRMIAGVVLLAVIVLGASTALFVVGYRYGLGFMGSGDFRTVIHIVLAYITILVVITVAVGITKLLHRIRKAEK